MYAENFGDNSFSPYGGRGYTSLVDTRLLELRSGLFFHYPRSSGGRGKSVMFFLPFWENPSIKESNNANLAEYKVINRNGSLFAHTGTRSRKISVDFTLTLPHIYQSHNSVEKAVHNMAYLAKDITYKEREKFRQLNAYNSNLEVMEALGFRGQHKDVNGAQEAYNQWRRAWMAIHHGEEDTSWTKNIKSALTDSEYFLHNSPTVNDDPLLSFVKPQIERNQQRRTNFAQKLLKTAADTTRVKSEAKATAKNDKFLRMVRSVSYLIDIVRSSITNNAETTSLSPPMVRIRNGAMYRDTPCICKGYKISVDDKAGMDLRTLLPNRIKISLDLLEVRTGNFGSFSPGEYIDRDNLVGWEAVIGGSGFDPGELTGEKASVG